MVNPTAVKACPDCSEAIEETEPRYECGQCSETFGESNGDGGGNRCPGCGKFAAREGDCHEGCQSSVEDATDGFQCGECKEVHDKEQEAAECCVEDPDEEEEPVVDEETGKEVETETFKAEVGNLFIVERDEFMVNAHGEERMKSPFWISYVRLEKKQGSRKSFEADNQSLSGTFGYVSWHRSNGMEISVKMRTDPATGLVHGKRIIYGDDQKTREWGPVEWGLVLRPVDGEGMRKWRGEMEKEARQYLKEQEAKEKKRTRVK